VAGNGWLANGAGVAPAMPVGAMPHAGCHLASSISVWRLAYAMASGSVAASSAGSSDTVLCGLLFHLEIHNIRNTII